MTVNHRAMPVGQGGSGGSGQVAPGVIEVVGPRPPVASLEPLPAGEFGFDEARHLLNRAGFGGTPAQVRTLAGWGLDKSLDYLLNFEKAADEPDAPDLFKNDLKRPPTPDERDRQRRAARERDEDTLAEIRLRIQQRERQDRDQMRRVQQWWLTRLIETGRPLQEKLVLFWHGHFATNYRTIEDSYHMYAQNRLFRKHAAGKFSELLRAIIRDPAMLAYLDNNDSRKGRPNENLAREIMELFALGVGAYSENDIKEGARALTGYTFRDDEFYFDKANHDTGTKRILGASGGIDGDGFVDAILRHPACATFVTTKLYRFFAHDYPTGEKPFDASAQRVIKDLADRFRTDYDVSKLLRRLLASRHFFDLRVRNEQVKSPVQLIVGAVRSLRVPPRDLGVLTDASDRMGQSIFFPPSVKGWDGGRSWINTSTMFVRQNLMVFLLTGRRPQGRDGLADREKFDASKLLAELRDALPTSAAPGSAAASDRDPQLSGLCRFVLGTPEPRAIEVLQRFLATRGGGVSEQNLPDLLLLMTAMPEYQLC
jgi:hypothetical protein